MRSDSGAARRLLALGLVGLLATLPGSPAETGTTGHATGACDASRHLAHAGWDLCWAQSDLRAQGIELHDVSFQGESIAARLGFPFTLTRYDTPDHGPYKDVLGVPTHNPGNGWGAMQLASGDCPRFVGQGDLLHNGRLCVERRLGPEPMLVVWGRYDLNDYRFLQGYRLDSRGVLEPFVRLGGRLVDGDLGADARDHVHHLYWRLDLAVGAAGNDRLERRGAPAALPLTVLPPGDRCAGAGPPGAWLPLERECRDDGAGPDTRWRIADPHDVNAHGHAKSVQLEVRSDLAPDAFAHFDLLLLQGHGASREIGYEVPKIPLGGDAPLVAYYHPAEPVSDPVLWVAQHVHHEPRDEDRGSMTYHEVSLRLSPRDLFHANPGEDTYRS